jgi:hypothetical protein
LLSSYGGKQPAPLGSAGHTGARPCLPQYRPAVRRPGPSPRPGHRPSALGGHLSRRPPAGPRAARQARRTPRRPATPARSAAGECGRRLVERLVPADQAVRPRQCPCRRAGGPPHLPITVRLGRLGHRGGRRRAGQRHLVPAAAVPRLPARVLGPHPQRQQDLVWHVRRQRRPSLRQHRQGPPLPCSPGSLLPGPQPTPRRPTPTGQQLTPSLQAPARADRIVGAGDCHDRVRATRPCARWSWWLPGGHLAGADSRQILLECDQRTG